MSEEVLFRLGLDASALKRGTMTMLDQQKKAAMDYVSFWKKSITEREQAEIQADVRAATRSNRARMLQRQRAQERTSDFKKELAAQLAASGITAEAKNLRGVSLENLARNVIGRGGGRTGIGGHGLGGVNSIAMREMTVLAREISRGNFSRVPGSLSILVQSLGKLGAVASAIINPITGVIAGLAAGAAVVYKIGRGATQTIQRAGDVGFSTAGYQSFIRQAGRESGGAAGAQSALDTLSQHLGALRSGDMGEMRKFRQYGVATTGPHGGNLSNEQVFQNILEKYEGMSDPAKRAAFAMDMFGESYKKFVKTLNEGATGMAAVKGKNVLTSGELAVLSATGQTVGDTATAIGGSIKQGFGTVLNAYKFGYAAYAQAVNPGLRLLNRETERGQAIDAEEQRLIAAGKIKPRHMTQAQFEKLHPDLAAGLKSATLRSEDLQNELDDRGKVSLSDLAAMGRRFTGHIRPRQYTVTDRMRTAMRVDDLDAQANIDFMRGDDAGMKKLKGEADAIRKANPWLMAADRDPTRKVTEQLIEANKALKDIQEMAKMVMSQK